MLEWGVRRRSPGSSWKRHGCNEAHGHGDVDAIDVEADVILEHEEKLVMIGMKRPEIVFAVCQIPQNWRSNPDCLVTLLKSGQSRGRAYFSL